ncbi:MAG: hypothetical protein CAPSK01_000800 [Candidatus Accumulibacter vicinus]|uniref:Uncharacterized protein n=1 Tax=Candidatus Accumulibacter vicinus TaxID=2954382 RepID=A0A084Y493_9PROT|nr:MAG: hypothetical protein CAPSK01_000800 [Candidatus Accumulibacter vicinus]
MISNSTLEGTDTIGSDVEFLQFSDGRASLNSGVISFIPEWTKTYSLAANAATYNEGSIAGFTLTTTGVVNGTALSYVLSGTGITAVDVTGGALTGNVTVNNNAATITVALANDLTTEGVEMLTASIRGTSATASTSIADTSLTPATSYTVPGTLGNDFFIPSAGNNYLGGGGNDTYIISPHTLSGAVTAKITDTEGANVIQWVDGMTLAASSFYNNAAQLTLSTGAKVQILGASKFHFQLGANAPAGDTATSQTYAEFASTLGVILPAAGGAPVSGTPNFVVPSSSGSAFTVVDLSSGTVTASAAAEEFRYDFQIVGGRVTTGGDGAVTIHGFDATQDKLVFVNTTNHTVYSEAEFKVLPGVSVAENPFGNSTSIYFDPASGVSGGVTLTGIVDASLSLIVVETM